MKRILTIPVIIALTFLPACASHDAQDRYVLGGATQANIALQSDRDVSEPNSKEVDGSSGVRAVKAVKALNEGQTKQLASAGTGGAE